ncbi:MAG TPA: hypothetical protein VJ787_07545 [Thermoleophilia bacterium]|nr:hypothetical protein [Thermoleophilia bacterium]
MKLILILLLILAVALIIVGAANNDERVDLHYLFGTWYGVSLLLLMALTAALVVVVGLIVAALGRMGGYGARRKLERELDHTYGRLREAEAQTAQLASSGAATAQAGGSGGGAVAAEVAREESPTALPEAQPVPSPYEPPASPADEARTVVDGPGAAPSAGTGGNAD